MVRVPVKWGVRAPVKKGGQSTWKCGQSTCKIGVGVIFGNRGKSTQLEGKEGGCEGEHEVMGTSKCQHASTWKRGSECLEMGVKSKNEK